MELLNYLRILLKRWWIIIPIVLVTIGCTAFLTLRQVPIYSATTTFIVSPSTTIFSDPRSFLSGLDVLGARGSVANTYSDIATSRSIRNDTIQALGLNPDQAKTMNVTSKILAGTNVINITVEGPDPELITSFANKLGDITVKYVGELYGVYDLKILDLAETPVFPIKPNLKLNLVLAAVLSLAMGVGLAFLTEYLDDTLRSPDEISQAFQSPLIGLIPVMEKVSSKSLYMVALPRSAVAESFRSLRTNLEFASVDKPMKRILVTSISAGDGKSSVATNLAVAYAQSGKKVVLVDADLRRPTVHQFFSIANRRGITNIISGQVNLADAIYRSTEGGIGVIPAGTLPPNPAEMLSSKKMEQILSDLEEVADVVILDSAPLLVADTWGLSVNTDGVILVVGAGCITKKTAKAVADRIQLGRVQIVGLVVNRVMNGSHSDYYYSGYFDGVSKYYGIESAREGTSSNGTKPKSQRGLFSRAKKRPKDGRIRSDAILYDIPAPVLERISTEHNRDTLDLLLEISRIQSAPSTLPELVQQLLRLALVRVGGSSGSFIVLDEIGQIACGALYYAGKVFSPPVEQLTDIVEHGLAGWVIQNCQTALIASTRDDPRWLMRPWEQKKKSFRSIISIPLTTGGRAFGVITLAHPSIGMFTQNDLVLLKTIGACISFNSAVMIPSNKETR